MGVTRTPSMPRLHQAPASSRPAQAGAELALSAGQQQHTTPPAPLWHPLPDRGAQPLLPACFALSALTGVEALGLDAGGGQHQGDKGGVAGAARVCKLHGRGATAAGAGEGCSQRVKTGPGKGSHLGSQVQCAWKAGRCCVPPPQPELLTLPVQLGARAWTTTTQHPTAHASVGCCPILSAT